MKKNTKKLSRIISALGIILCVSIIGLLSQAAEAATCGNGICEAGETKESCPGDCPQFIANINKFKKFQMRGIWGGIAGDNLKDEIENIIEDDIKLQAAIDIYQKYNFNTVLIGAKYLRDSNTNLLTEAGKRFLAKMAAAGIRVIISRTPAYNQDGTLNDNDNEKVKGFMKSLYDEYHDLYGNAKPEYTNILVYLIGDDVFGEDGVKIKATHLFAQFIRNEVYNNPGSINQALDIPLMIDCGVCGKEAVTDSISSGSLKNDIEIIGGYAYGFLSSQDSHNVHLKKITDRLEAAGVKTDDRFFTVLQAHNMAWYKATFHNTDDYNSDNIPYSPDVYPEGIQSASLIYQALRNNNKHYLFFYRPNLINDPNNFSQDRLAEIAIANKLVDILWEPVLKNSTLNTNIEQLFDSTGVFEGNVLNFTDSQGKKGALLVINANKTNNIFGKAASEVGKNVIFSQYSKNELTHSLSFTALGIEKRADVTTSLKIRQIDFTKAGNVSFTIPVNTDNIKLTRFAPSATTSAINENAFILMTYDDAIVTAIDNALQAYKTTDNKNIATRLACEALETRFNKTDKEFGEIESAGWTIPNEAPPCNFKTRLENIRAEVNNRTALGYRQLRSVISNIGDLQVDLYNYIRKNYNDPADFANPDNLYRVNDRLVYPDGDNYCVRYGNPQQYGYADYREFIIPKLCACDPQKLHFYLLDKYLDCIDSKFNYIDSVSAASIQNSSSSTISWTTYGPASSQVAYRKAADSIYTLTPIKDQATKVKSHKVTLTGMLQNTRYYYYVTSVDKYNNELISSVYTFKHDNTASSTPVVTIENGAQYTNKNNQLYASWACSDDESGIVEYQYRITKPTGEVITNGSGTVTEKDPLTGEVLKYVTAGNLSLCNGCTYYFKVIAKNGAGILSAEGTSLGIKVDSTAPQTSDSIDGLWHKVPVTVTLNASDSLSGVDKTYYSTNATGPDIIYSVYSGFFTISTDGIYTIKYYSSDNAGNSEAVKTALTQVMIDTILPAGNILIKGGANFTNSASVALNLSAADAGSGISQMKFSNDNSTWTSWENYATSKNWTVLLGDGVKTVYVKFKDNAGNISSAYSDTIILDTTAPAGSISINNGAAYTKSTAVTLNLSATDAGSGVAQMQFSNDNITYSAVEAYAQTKSWALTSGNGTKTVYAKFKDAAGNWSGAYSDTIILDTTPAAPSSLTATPSSATRIDLKWTDNSNNETGFKIERKLGATGVYAQIATVGANVTTYSNTSLAEGTNYYYRVRAYNADGNSAYTNEASATTKLKLPTALTATALTGKQIKLIWVDNSGIETGYEIERKIGSAGTYSKIATKGVNITTHTDSGLTAGTTYYYRIRAYKTGGIYSSYATVGPVKAIQ